jgi:hypothetical protein
MHATTITVTLSSPPLPSASSIRSWQARWGSPFARKRTEAMAALHKFLGEGVIARQLLKMSRSKEIGAAVSQVGDMGHRH